MNANKDKPGRLREVSHLFLSEKSRKSRKDKETEAVIWAAVPEGEFNRAYFAAGLAVALASTGGEVTLVETGWGLPNCGYYFSGEPDDYLTPLLKEGKILCGSREDRIRYVYSVRYDQEELLELDLCPPVFPHFVLQVFSVPRKEEYGELTRSLKAASGNYSFSRNSCGAVPEVLMVLTRHSSYCDRLARVFRGNHEDIVVLFIHPGNDYNSDESDDSIAMPDFCLWGGEKKIPPEDRQFGGLAEGIMQMISTRRRRKNEGII